MPASSGRSSETRIMTFMVGDYAADSDAIKTALTKLDHAIKITGIKVAHDTAITAQDTDYNTVAITDGTNTIASFATGPAATGQSFVAGTFVALTLVAAYVEQAAAQTLKVEYTKTGNGLAGSGLVVQIEYVDYNA